MPLDIVVDTNLYVSYIFSKPGSTIPTALRYAHQAHQVHQSPQTFTEIETVLNRSKFAKYLPASRREAMLEDIFDLCKFTDPRYEVHVSPDPKDNMLFALAKAVDADLLISGDTKHVLSIPEFEGTQTISPADFIDPENLGLYFGHQASLVRRSSGIFVPEQLH